MNAKELFLFNDKQNSRESVADLNNLQSLLDFVCSTLRLSEEDMLDTDNKRSAVERDARVLFMWLVRKLGYKPLYISRYTGFKTTSVVHLSRCYESHMDKFRDRVLPKQQRILLRLDTIKLN